MIACLVHGLSESLACPQASGSSAEPLGDSRDSRSVQKAQWVWTETQGRAETDRRAPAIYGGRPLAECSHNHCGPYSNQRGRPTGCKRALDDCHGTSAKHTQFKPSVSSMANALVPTARQARCTPNRLHGRIVHQLGHPVYDGSPASGTTRVVQWRNSVGLATLSTESSLSAGLRHERKSARCKEIEQPTIGWGCLVQSTAKLGPIGMVVRGLIDEHLAARWWRRSHLLLIDKSDHDAQRSMWR